MNKLILIAIATTLAGCSAGPDNSVRTAISEPVESESSERYLEQQMSASWNKQKADACVHRQAYRLSQSSDPAETVAKAAVELADEYRVLLSLRLQSQGVIDLGNGWMIVPRAAAREARDALQSECGNWFIARTVRFRTARGRAVWEALLQFS